MQHINIILEQTKPYILLGVMMFTFSEKTPTVSSAHTDTSYGLTLLLLYLFCDSFTSQWQSRVYKSYGIDQYQMMLGMYGWTCYGYHHYSAYTMIYTCMHIHINMHIYPYLYLYTATT